MNRPLIQRRIDELEAIFEAKQGDPDALRLSEAELAFRSAPRAVTLLNRLKRAPDGGAGLPSPRQSILFDHKTPAASQVPLLEESQPAHSSPIPAMTLEDALKVLKVTTSAPWESIETSRRQAVERAHPGRLASLSKEKRSAVKEEARVANAAYRVLLQARSV